MHHQISPAILYWGTPVILITSENEDGTSNIAPMSSAWWLGDRSMIGLGSSAQTTKNIIRTQQCVLNLPSEDMTAHVNSLARTTGANPVNAWKESAGYRFVKDKFAHAKLTPQPSDLVSPSRIQECPVHMEAELIEATGLMKDSPSEKGTIFAMELKILRVHVEDELRLGGYANRIDSEKWQPLIMCFSEFYGMGKTKLVSSRLSEIDEEAYRSRPPKAPATQIATDNEEKYVLISEKHGGSRELV
uniref:Jcg001w n=1 Tax=Paracoccidioides brasiliensis TaxID=121759 RepID=Q5K669_PARBR|nr:Jcg001w [Paracoccidioides brasiliensis]